MGTSELRFCTAMFGLSALTALVFLPTSWARVSSAQFQFTAPGATSAVCWGLQPDTRWRALHVGA